MLYTALTSYKPHLQALSSYQFPHLCVGLRSNVNAVGVTLATLQFIPITQASTHCMDSNQVHTNALGQVAFFNCMIINVSLYLVGDGPLCAKHLSYSLVNTSRQFVSCLSDLCVTLTLLVVTVSGEGMQTFSVWHLFIVTGSILSASHTSGDKDGGRQED